MRRAKIVATLGPALDDRDRLRAAVEAGIDVARLNFSHGTHDDHARRFEAVRDVARRVGRNIGVLGDLQGPKIRLGLLPDDGVEVPDGEEIVLVPGVETLDDVDVEEGRVTLPVVYEALAADVDPGSLVLIDDGSIRLIVSRVEGDADGGPGATRVVARVVAGGTAKSRKGVNLPGVDVSAPSMTEKDKEDLKFAVDLGVDWFALSFVRRPSDLEGARQRIAEHGGEQPVVAKLERPESIEDLEAVIAAANAVMVARGDLGVEIGPERVPAIQKEIIAEANAAGKPVITATEMLESMIDAPRSTRAEASDVANAVFDGTDAVMLSGETAAGSYPVEAVRTMARIVEVAERSPQLVHPAPPPSSGMSVGRVVAQAAVQVARDVDATALVVFSLTGQVLELVSKYRPPMPLLGLTPRETTYRRTALMWGIEAVRVPLREEVRSLTETAEQAVVDGGWAQRGERVVIVSGTPGGSGGTNRVTVHTIGDPVRS